MTQTTNRSAAGSKSGSDRSALPRASLRDTLRVTMGVVAPTVAKGPIIRRPRVVGMAETLDLDTRAVRYMQQLRDKYAPGPLMLRIPGRHQAVILDPEHVNRVLDESPEPFATASSEKRAALAHFEPEGALVSHGAERAERRRFNEQALEHNSPVHHMARAFLPIVDEEARGILSTARRRGELDWSTYYEGWFRMIRRVVFGEAAADDRGIITLMERLRSRGNWAFLAPKRRDLREKLHRKIRGYLDRAEPGSLCGHMGSIPKNQKTSPENQIPQWLFAADPAAMASYRALALLVAHPEQAERARAETASGEAAAQPYRPFLRAAVCESLRLWPTTPMVLRQTTRETTWGHGVMPAHTGILIFAPFFHRDDARLPFAHRFTPDLWQEDGREIDGSPPRRWPLIPFSSGPGICPGRNLVLLLTTGMLAALLADRTVRMKKPSRLDPEKPMPGILDNYTVRFELGR